MYIICFKSHDQLKHKRSEAESTTESSQWVRLMDELIRELLAANPGVSEEQIRHYLELRCRGWNAQVSGMFVIVCINSFCIGQTSTTYTLGTHRSKYLNCPQAFVS